MQVYDVLTKSGKLISTIYVGPEESIRVGTFYDESYLDQYREMYNEEVSIKSRIEIDKYEKFNRKNS